MKKIVIAIAVIGGAAVAGAPYITGAMAESETRKLVAEFNKKSDEYGVTKIVSYERGFRSSTVAYEYQLPTGLAALTEYDETLKYNCDYAHGMTGIEYSCDLSSNEGYKKFIDQYFSGDDPISITGGISAFGGFTQEIASKAIDKKMDDGTVLKLAPSNITLASGSDFAAFDSVANFGALEISASDGSLNMEPSNMVFNMKPTELGLYEGDYRMQVGNLNFVDKQQRTVMEGVEISGASTERGDKMDSTVTLTMKKMEAEGGQAVALDDVSFSLDLLGVNSQALLEYQEFLRTMQAEMFANAGAGGEPEIDPNLMMAILPIMEKMLDKDLNLKMALSGKLMGKQNSADIDLKLLEKTSFAQFSAFMFNPESVLKNLDIKLNGSLNKELVEGHPMAGAIIGNSPLFSAEGDNYQTQIKLGAESQVNGKTVTFQELQGMVMSSAM